MEQLPRAAGRIIVNFAKDRFKQEAWHDEGRERWPARRKRDKVDRRYKRNPRGLLVASGRLRRSIQVNRMSRQYVTVGTDVPYAAIHNDGGTIDHPGGTAYVVREGRAIWISNRRAQGKNYPRTKPHQITIPRRRFLGKSKLLEKRIVMMIEKKLLDRLPKK